MSHAWFHAQSSARQFGGRPEDYLALHDFFDATKAHFADARHRALRHHSAGIFELEARFGATIRNSDGRDVPVRLIGEQHVREDCGGIIPTVADWLSRIAYEPWMNFGYRRSLEVLAGRRAAPEPGARACDNSAPLARRIRRRVVTSSPLEPSAPSNDPLPPA